MISEDINSNVVGEIQRNECLIKGMRKMNKGLYDYLVQEENQPLTGWNFDYLERSGRMVEFPLKWHLPTIIKDYFKEAHSVLDMGTGGGEFLSSLAPLPAKTVATEGYEPSISVAKTCLEPLGVSVVHANSNQILPLESNQFDIVINRHEPFDACEVARLLNDGGVFITQQVGGLNECELNLWLNAEPCEFSNWSLRTAVNELREAGFHIEVAKDDISLTRFYDIGAIVYYLKVINQQVPNFSVEKYYDRLEIIHRLIHEKGYVDITRHRFLIVAKKETDQ